MTDKDTEIRAGKTFTEALTNLQNAAAEIGRQATTLEDSLRLFEAGMKEAEFCREILDKADQKITVYEQEDSSDA
jgi:exodeoxyribonuclease VII small subunit